VLAGPSVVGNWGQPDSSLVLSLAVLEVLAVYLRTGRRRGTPGQADFIATFITGASLGGVGGHLMTGRGMGFTGQAGFTPSF
jgi:hypothetical protein